MTFKIPLPGLGNFVDTRLYSALIVLLLLTGCTTNNVAPYTPPDPSLTETASLTATAELKGLFLQGRKTRLNIVPCDANEGEYSGYMDFQEAEFGQKVLIIPANQRLIIGYGTVDPGWKCMVYFGLKAIANQHYKLNYTMKFAGCRVSVLNPSGEPVEELSFLSIEENFAEDYCRVESKD